MRRAQKRFALASLLLLSVSCDQPKTPALPTPTVDWTAVGAAMGKAGTLQPDGPYKIGLPRSDLQVKVGALQIKATLALGSWVAFLPMPGGTMAMGDLVLTEDEINPVISKLQEGGIEQSALHNHLLGAQPPIMYMHIQGHGDAVKLADTIHAALALTQTPFGAGGTPPAVDLDTAQLDQIIGVAGKNNGGVYQFSVARTEVLKEQGMVIPPSMGMATALNFQPTGSGNAAITGDFVMLAGEVNRVIRALRAANIQVTALHSHMLNDDPRLFFMHFFASGDAVQLARGLRAALDQTRPGAAP